MNSRYNVVYIISSSWRGILDTTSCDKVCQWLATGRWFSLGTLVFSTNKTDRHDLTEILLKVALNTIILNPQNLSKVTFQNNILPLYMKMDHACTMSGSRFSWHLIFYIFIFFARTTWPYWTKLECDTGWMVLFRNCALWHCLTFKMTDCQGLPFLENWKFSSESLDGKEPYWISQLGVVPSKLCFNSAWDVTLSKLGLISSWGVISSKLCSVMVIIVRYQISREWSVRVIFPWMLVY